MREDKKDIITHKFSVGKPYVEPHIATTVTKGNKTYYLAPTKRDPCHELGNPGECGSYWTKSLKIIHIWINWMKYHYQQWNLPERYTPYPI